MVRKIIIALLGVVLIVAAFMLSKSMTVEKQAQKPTEEKTVTTVFTQTVQNSDLPITLSTNGTLQSKNRVELYSEVQGIFESSSNTFKPGVRFSIGAVLLKINSDEHKANLRSQKSNLKNQIVLLLPDLKLDYPASFPEWEAYVRNFDKSPTLEPLPKPSSEQEDLFITGRNIYSTWYNVKNLEERLQKYTIRAPFAGILTEALVNPGTLIRNGQKLGEFIDPSTYELEVAINISYMDFLKVGNQVKLHNLERTRNWNGRIIRVNGTVDPNTQTIQVYIQVSGQGLREGMYLEADLEARKEENAFEIDRKLLFDENKVFLVQDSTLEVAEIIPVFFNENSVIIKGLNDGVKVLSKSVPGAYAGMRVKEYQER